MNRRKIKEKSILDLLDQQADKMVEAGNQIQRALKAMLDGDYQQMAEAAGIVQKLEKTGDRIKEALNEKLFVDKSPLEFTRVDRYEIIVKVDDVINQADIIANKLLLVDIAFPNALVEEARVFVTYATNAVSQLKQVLDALRQDFNKATEHSEKVASERREARYEQWKLLKALYAMNLDAQTLILTREIIMETTKLADVAEVLSDFLEMTALKYSHLL